MADSLSESSLECLSRKHDVCRGDWRNVEKERRRCLCPCHGPLYSLREKLSRARYELTATQADMDAAITAALIAQEGSRAE